MQKGTTYPVEVMDRDEAGRLLSHCGRGSVGPRNKALIAILYRGMLRVSEALSLHEKDLNEAAGTVRVLRGKGGRPRTIGLDGGAWTFLNNWREQRRQLGLNGESPLFCTLEVGKPVQTAYVRKMMKRVARRAGIEKRVHPHALRHTGACELREEGMDVGVISRQLGHTSIITTQRYLDHIRPQAVINAIRGREWSVEGG